MRELLKGVKVPAPAGNGKTLRRRQQGSRPSTAATATTAGTPGSGAPPMLSATFQYRPPRKASRPPSRTGGVRRPSTAPAAAPEQAPLRCAQFTPQHMPPSSLQTAEAPTPPPRSPSRRPPAPPVRDFGHRAAVHLGVLPTGDELPVDGVDSLKALLTGFDAMRQRLDEALLERLEMVECRRANSYASTRAAFDMTTAGGAMPASAENALRATRLFAKKERLDAALLRARGGGWFGALCLELMTDGRLGEGEEYVLRSIEAVLATGHDFSELDFRRMLKRMSKAHHQSPAVLPLLVIMCREFGWTAATYQAWFERWERSHEVGAIVGALRQAEIAAREGQEDVLSSLRQRSQTSDIAVRRASLAARRQSSAQLRQSFAYGSHAQAAATATAMHHVQRASKTTKRVGFKTAPSPDKDVGAPARAGLPPQA